MASKRGSKWKTFLVQRVPFCDWIVRYSKEDAVGDIIAGITICLTMVPQSIAYAALAGLDPQYGLNSAFVGCFVYVFFGTIKEVVIGPSSLLALLTYEYTRHLNVDFVILLCFLSGVVELLMGMLHLGFLVSFISAPVVSGFTSATSIIIVVSQIGGLLGIRTEASGFIGKIRKIVENAKYFRWGDAILGFACIAACLLLRKLKHVEIDPARPSYGFVNKLCWFLSIGRNFLAVFLSSCIAVVYNHYYESTPFKMTKAVESGVPSFQLPPMSTQIGNQTYNFTEMVVELGAGYFVIPVVSVLANVAIAKAFAKGTVDATQEMLALSMSNMLGSCFQSLPTNGAFTRSAVMSASGVRTPLAGFYSAFLTMTALQFLGPYFHCIPRASLSAILIAAVIFLIDWEIIMPLWRCKKFDLCALVATFVFCLYLGVEVGILFGVIISLADLVYKWYKVQVAILQNKGPNGSYIILQPSLPLFFPSVDHLSSVIIKTAENRVEDTIPIVIDCRTVRNSDYSVAKVFMADKDWKAKCRKIVKRAFRRHIPISEWIKKYSKEDAVCDLIAGVTISLTIIPQSIAYAALAGLDPRYGLNSAFMGSFIYVFFGSVKEVVIGPSSLMALLTFQYTNHLNVDFVVLLCFLSGCVEFIMGAFNLGFLISFISVPVVSGFTTSAALIVLISQFKGLFGIKFDSESTYESLVKLCQHVREIQVGDTILGISCIASILLLRKLKFYKVPKTVPGAKYIQKTIWFISNARNALAVFITSYISIVFSKDGGHPPFATTKAVESGIPPFILPPMSTVIGNKTYNFQEMVVELGAGYLIIPVTAVLANVAIAKAFSSGLVDATQEMIALSLCNVFGSFVQSMPTCGAFSRSAVISSSGVKSPLACLYSATLTMLAMTFLAPYFHYIPKAVLSAVLISAVLFLIDYQIIHPLWKSNKLDGCILVATTLVCLFVGVEIGLLFGVLVGLVDLIFKWSRPEVTVQKFQTQQGGYLLVTPMMGLYFPSVDYLYSLILKTNASNEDKLPILIDCSRLTGTDYSIGRSFKSLQCVLEKKGQILGLVDIQTKLKKPLEAAGCQPGMYCDSDKIEDFLFGENHNNFIALTEVSTENIIKEATKGS